MLLLQLFSVSDVDSVVLPASLLLQASLLKSRLVLLPALNEKNDGQVFDQTPNGSDHFQVHADRVKSRLLRELLWQADEYAVNPFVLQIGLKRGLQTPRVRDHIALYLDLFVAESLHVLEFIDEACAFCVARCLVANFVSAVSKFHCVERLVVCRGATTVTVSVGVLRSAANLAHLYKRMRRF